MKNTTQEDTRPSNMALLGHFVVTAATKPSVATNATKPFPTCPLSRS